MKKLFYRNFQLGILGGGQLGRMLIQSGVNFNLNIHVLDGDAAAPCRNIAHAFTQGDINDFQTVYEFGRNLDLVTIEIENVNVDALEKLEQEGVAVYPPPAVIRVIQDKRTQKQFFKDNDIPTAEFHLTENREDVNRLAEFLPAVNKLGRAGYDGRGVQVLKDQSDLDKAFDAPGILEKLIPFEKELTVIISRNPDGDTSVFPCVEQVLHPEHNLVEYLFAPAEISEEVAEKARNIALKVVDRLGHIGILAVELFLTRQGEILVNELAPRPHNSGHHTIKANFTSQYEQHLRAILSLPPGSTRTKRAAGMINLLGEDGYDGEALYEGLEEALKVEGVYVHLYGKEKTRPFRKMGHITILDESLKNLKEKVDLIKGLVKVKS